MLPDPAIHARGVCVAFEGVDVLHGVDVDVPWGAVTVVAGANGAGKSTLVEVLAGVREPRRGSVIRRGAVALVVQRPVAPDTLPLTVGDVVAMGTWRRGRRGRGRSAAAADALGRVGLAALAHRRFATLSGGQRQRALLAQAIAGSARVLLLDEPAAGLDAASRDRTRAILAEEARRGVAVACVTHDERSIAEADRVVRLERGRVVS